MSRTPFQLFKLSNPGGTITEFNSLPAVAALPFKAAAASEKLALVSGVGSSGCVPNSVVSNSVKASIAKALADYLALRGQIEELKATQPSSPLKKSASRSRGRSASAGATPGDDEMAVVRSALTMLDLAELRIHSLLEIQAAAVKVKETEALFKKAARGDQIVVPEEPLRKSARIQSKRELAAEAAPSPRAKRGPARSKPNTSADDDVVEVHTNSTAPSVFNVDEATPVVVSLESLGGLPELSNAISAIGDDASIDATAPLPRDPNAPTDSTNKPRQPAKRLRLKEAAVSASSVTGVDSVADAPKPIIAPKAKTQKTLFAERRPALTYAEKKVQRSLYDLLHQLAAVYTTRDITMKPFFTQLQESVRAIKHVIDEELSHFGADHDVTKPVPFPGVTCTSVFDAIEASRKAFDSNVDECQTEFDEFLIHPIAHAVLCVLNTLEGYQSPPPRLQTEKEIEARHAAREAEKARREAALSKLQQKAREKEEKAKEKEDIAAQRIREREEEAARKEEERNALRNMGKPLDESHLIEDTSIVNTTPLGYIQYSTLPLPQEEYDLALYAWAMLVSLPRPLMLSQFPFAMFLTALKENKSDNGLIEEIFRSLDDTCIHHYQSVVVPTLPSSTPKLVTRGRDWFSLAIEFISISNGTKKSRVTRKPKSESESDDDNESDDTTSSDDEEESSDDSTSDAEASSGEVESVKSQETEDLTTAKPAVEDVDSAPPTDVPSISPQDRRLRETLDKVAAMRNYASWGNIEVSDRLNILTYMVSYALDSDALREEAERLAKLIADETAQYEKKLADARAEAEKELRLLAKAEAASKKPLPIGSEAPVPIDFAKKKAEIISRMEALITEARVSKYTKADQEDRGARIMPLGQDRYRRMYWRMPMDKSILVQTVPGLTASQFPITGTPPELPPTQDSVAARPRRGFVLDVEVDEPPRKRGRDDGSTTTSATTTPGMPALSGDATQCCWGVIRPEYLPQFVESLDSRGRREGPLKIALQPLQAYLKHVEAPHEGVRMTRSRAAANGYLNKLRAF